MFLRELAKKLILTGNPTCYIVEMPRIAEALKIVGPMDTLLAPGHRRGRRCALLRHPCGARTLTIGGLTLLPSFVQRWILRR